MPYLIFLAFLLTFVTPLQAQTLTQAEAFWRQDVARYCQGFPSKDHCDDGDSVIFNGLLCSVGEQAGCDAVQASQDGEGRFWRSPRRNPGNLGEEKSFSRDQTLGVLLYLAKTRDQDAAQRWLRWIEDNRTCSFKNPFNGRCAKWIYRVCRDNEQEICTMTPAIWAMFKRVWEYIGLPTTHEMRNNDTLDVSDLELIAVDQEETGYRLHLKAVSAFLRLTMASSVGKSQEIIGKLYRRQPDNPFFQVLAEGPSEAVTNRVLELCPKVDDDLSFRRFQWAWERDTASEAWRESMGWDCIFMARFLENYGTIMP
jgi:hypothetical protein